MGNEATDQTAILVIGDAPAPAHATRIVFAALDAGVLARTAPDSVICRLFSTDCDAMTVAETLVALRWTGRLWVVAPGLPNRTMVQRELQAGATGLKVEVVPELQA